MVRNQFEARLAFRRALIVAALAGTLALAGCSPAEPSTEASAPAPDPAQAEQKAEPAEPEPKMETFEFPYDWVIEYEDRMNPDTRYDVPSTYFEELGITDYEVSDEGICTVEAPEGTWDKLKARVFDFMKKRVLANHIELESEDLAPLSCEVGDEFSSVAITLDVVLDGSESTMVPGNLALFAVNQGAVYRTFAGLDPVFHATVLDRNGDIIIDRDYDASKQQEMTEDIRGAFQQ